MTSPAHIVHVAETPLSLLSGMGRVAWHWRAEAIRRGHTFTYIGPDETGPLRHPRHFPAAARRALSRLATPASCLLVHEPASGAFVDAGVPLVLVSHGIERRMWNLQLAGRIGDRPPLRTRVLFPWWRLRLADRGLTRADRLYLINREDVAFAQAHYGRTDRDIFAFRNGVNAIDVARPSGAPHVLFIGSWITRKGTSAIIHTATALSATAPDVHWTLAGTGVDAATVAAAFPAALRDRLDIRRKFSVDDEASLFAGAPIFVLPSTFEGQPLALLQAMAAGCCCITTNTSGQRDLIVDGQNGLLIPVGDAQALVGALTRVLADRELRDRLGVAARASVEARTWSTVAAEVLDDLEAFLSHTGHRS